MEDNAHVTQHSASSNTYRHSHINREGIADDVLVGGYIGTSPSHPSSFASLYRAPPSNPPRSLSLQLELAPHTRLLSCKREA